MAIPQGRPNIPTNLSAQERQFLKWMSEPEDWHEVGTTGEPSFENSWVNHSAGQTSAAFYKDPYGVVHLKGLVKSGTIGGLPIFTLPIGYRSDKAIHLASVSNSAFGALRINADGTIDPIVGSTAWISLDGISYRV